jgi:YD repeat-containing protein
LGRLVRYRLGPNLRDLRYDAADRITSYTHYAAAGGAAQPALDQSFGYDAAGRLKTITTAGASWTIAYDANGNRTGVTLNGTTSAYSTEATSNRLSSTTNPARSFSYDPAGNTTSSTAVNPYTATYNLAGRLATLAKAGVTTTHSVDGNGRRVRKFSSTGAASTVIFVYDQGGQILASTTTPAKPSASTCGWAPRLLQSSCLIRQPRPATRSSTQFTPTMWTRPGSCSTTTALFAGGGWPSLSGPRLPRPTLRTSVPLPPSALPRPIL